MLWKAYKGGVVQLAGFGFVDNNASTPSKVLLDGAAATDVGRVIGCRTRRIWFAVTKDSTGFAGESVNQAQIEVTWTTNGIVRKDVSGATLEQLVYNGASQGWGVSIPFLPYDVHEVSLDVPSFGGAGGSAEVVLFAQFVPIA